MVQLGQCHIILEGETKLPNLAIADVIALLSLDVRLARAELLRFPLCLRLLPLPQLVLLLQLVFPWSCISLASCLYRFLEVLVYEMLVSEILVIEASSSASWLVCF